MQIDNVASFVRGPAPKAGSVAFMGTWLSPTVAGKLTGRLDLAGCRFMVEAWEVAEFGRGQQVAANPALQAEHDCLADVFAPTGDFETVELAGREYAVFLRPLGKVEM